VTKREEGRPLWGSTGIRYEAPDGNRKTLESDLIVDASGNGSLTIEFLKTIEGR
jgi:hypothetical protein